MSSFSTTSRKRSSDDTTADADMTKIMSAAASAATTSSSKTQLRVRIKQFHGVAKWTWNVGGGGDNNNDNNNTDNNNTDNGNDEEEDDVCGICQSAFEGCPPGVKFPGDESPVVFGLCGKLNFNV